MLKCYIETVRQVEFKQLCRCVSGQTLTALIECTDVTGIDAPVKTRWACLKESSVREPAGHVSVGYFM